MSKTDWIHGHDAGWRNIGPKCSFRAAIPENPTECHETGKTVACRWGENCVEMDDSLQFHRSRSVGGKRITYIHLDELVNIGLVENDNKACPKSINDFTNNEAKRWALESAERDGQCGYSLRDKNDTVRKWHQNW